MKQRRKLIECGFGEQCGLAGVGGALNVEATCVYRNQRADACEESVRMPVQSHSHALTI